MFEHSTPKTVRPTNDDRTEMRKRHGIRVHDQYDLGVGNDTIDLATVIEVPSTCCIYERQYPGRAVRQHALGPATSIIIAFHDWTTTWATSRFS